jgi:hypothetical protein
VLAGMGARRGMDPRGRSRADDRCCAVGEPGDAKPGTKAATYEYSRANVTAGHLARPNLCADGSSLNKELANAIRSV